MAVPSDEVPKKVDAPRKVEKEEAKGCSGTGMLHPRLSKCLVSGISLIRESPIVFVPFLTCKHNIFGFTMPGTSCTEL